MLLGVGGQCHFPSADKANKYTQPLLNPSIQSDNCYAKSFINSSLEFFVIFLRFGVFFGKSHNNVMRLARVHVTTEKRNWLLVNCNENPYAAFD